MAAARSMMEYDEKFVDDTCVICCHKSDLFCVGQCDHPVCFECGTRMRVLCQSKECSICRTELSVVYVVHYNPMIESFYNYSVLGSNNRFSANNNQLARDYGLRFENREALNAVQDLLAHVCTICKDEREFQSFELLSRHMRRDHELFYCELCVEYLNLFSWERKCYTRADLARHKRTGDPDDKSHKGHPLCQFCDQRFLDEDYLYRHLRRDHYFCHFCDVDGINKFYTDVNKLKEHFKSDHYLCEIGQCRYEELGVSFRHELDFKAHKTTVHARDMQKSDLKKELQVDLGFNFGPSSFRERLNQQRHQQQHQQQEKFNKSRAHQPISGGETRSRDRFPVENRSSRDRQPFNERPPGPAAANATSVQQTAPVNLLNSLLPLYDQLDSSSAAFENFRLATEDFPSLAGDQAKSRDQQQPKIVQHPHPSVIGQKQEKRKQIDQKRHLANNNLLADVVDGGRWGQFSSSLGENDFPALTDTVKTAAADQSGSSKMTNSQQATAYRRRRDSRSASPAGSRDHHQQPIRNERRAGLMMIDDDEDPRLVKKRQQQQQQAEKEAELGSDEDQSEQAEKPQTPPPSSVNALWGKPKIGGMSQSEFPSLPVKPGKSAATKKKSAYGTYKISSSASPVPTAAGAAASWSKKLVAEKPFIKDTVVAQPFKDTVLKQSTNLNLNTFLTKNEIPQQTIDFDSLVALPKTKARARLIAQSKQKQSVPPVPDKPEPDSKPDLSNPDTTLSNTTTIFTRLDDLNLTDNSLAAPTNQIQAAAMNIVPPPPGFSTTNQIGGPSASSFPDLPPGLDVPPPPPGFFSTNGNTAGIAGSHVIDIRVDTNSMMMNYYEKLDYDTDKSIPMEPVQYGPYIKPKSFQDRNRALFGALQSNMSPENLHKFKTVSSQYRRREVDPQCYYDTIKEILGDQLFDQFFLELCFLLPDIERQRQLINLHIDRCYSAPSGNKGISHSAPTTNNNNNNDVIAKNDVIRKKDKPDYCNYETMLKHCDVCKQVTSPLDFQEHLLAHLKKNDIKAEEEEFPALC